MNMNTNMFSGFGVGFDSVSKIRFQKFEFKDTYEYLIINLEACKGLNAEERLRMLKDLLLAFDSSFSKGYVTSYDLSKQPLISELLPSFLLEQDESYVSGDDCKESFK